MLKKLSYIGYSAALATGPALLTACSNTTAEQAPDPSVLFSLSSDAIHFENVHGMNTTLVMEGVDPDTIWFTDRPTRDSGAITTTRLAQDWQPGGTFASDPPNAALVLHEPAKVDNAVADTLVAEVTAVGYDPTNKTFRADLRVMGDQEAAALDGNLAGHGDRHDRTWPSHAGAASLFIDSVSLASVTGSATPSPSPSTSPSRPTPTSTSGHIVLCSNPSTCSSGSMQNITYNSTITFTTTITQSVTAPQPGAYSAPLRME